MKNHFQDFAVSFHLFLFSPFFPFLLFFTLLFFADWVHCSFLLAWYRCNVSVDVQPPGGPRSLPQSLAYTPSAPCLADRKPFPTALFLTYEDKTWGTATPRLSCLASWEWGNFPAVQPSECLWGHRAYTTPGCMHRGDDLKVSCYCSRATKCKLTECEEYYHGNISKQSSLWENITGKGKKSSPPHLEFWMKC